MRGENTRTVSSLPKNMDPLFGGAHTTWTHNGLKVGEFNRVRDVSGYGGSVREENELFGSIIPVEKAYPAFGTIARVKPYLHESGTVSTLVGTTRGDTGFAEDIVGEQGTHKFGLFSLWSNYPDEESSLMKDFWIYLPSSKDERRSQADMDRIVSLNNGSYTIQKIAETTAREETDLMSAKLPYGVDDFADLVHPSESALKKFQKKKAEDVVTKYMDEQSVNYGKKEAGEGEARDMGYGRWYRLKPNKNSTIKDKVTVDTIIEKGNAGKPLWVDEKTFIGNKDMREHLEYYFEKDEYKFAQDSIEDMKSELAEMDDSERWSRDEEEGLYGKENRTEEFYDLLLKKKKKQMKNNPNKPAIYQTRSNPWDLTELILTGRLRGKGRIHRDGILDRNAPMEMMIDGKVWDTLDGVYDEADKETYAGDKLIDPKKLKNNWWISKVNMTEYKDMPVYSSTVDSLRRKDSTFHIDADTDPQDVNWTIGRNFTMKGKDYMIDGESRENQGRWTHGYDVLPTSYVGELGDTGRGIWTPWALIWANFGGAEGSDSEQTFHLGTTEAPANTSVSRSGSPPYTEEFLRGAIEAPFGPIWKSKKILAEKFPTNFVGLRHWNADFNMQNTPQRESNERQSRYEEGPALGYLSPKVWSDILDRDEELADEELEGMEYGGPNLLGFELKRFADKSWMDKDAIRLNKVYDWSLLERFLRQKERTEKHIKFAEREESKKKKTTTGKLLSSRQSFPQVKLF